MSRTLPRPALVAALIVALGSAALLCHAQSFDFLCDDAFIALRYARNWAQLGSPVYNPGERVEGYTSFLFTLLVAAATRLGADPPAAARALGALSGVGALAAGYALGRRVEPGLPGWAGGAFVVAMLAASAPLAAWTLGGLETPLFCALATAGVVAGVELAAGGGRGQGLLAGVVLALATLARPEGALFAAAVGLVALVRRRSDPEGRRAVALMAGSYVALVGAHEAWRWLYYGHPLPNTFYVKSTGDGAALRQRGLAYARFAAGELGAPLLTMAALGLALPSRWAAPAGPGEADRRSAALQIAPLVVVPYVAYVVRVGGDFLDLYRFFAPLLPLAFAGLAALVGAAARAALDDAPPRAAQAAAAASLAALLVFHASTQRALGQRARAVSEPGRAARHLEPLGWTRLYARRWAAAGRWIAAHAQPGDTMAVGAAGAMPYHAGLPSLDLFGLCDAFVAHHGVVVGTRPGHQRYAPRDYILARRPTFLILNPEDTRASPARPRRDPAWNAQGYVWVEATIDGRLDGLEGPESPFYLRLLVRHERAEALRGRDDAAVAP